MAPMTRSSAALPSQMDGNSRPQDINEGTWQMVPSHATFDRELSEDRASSYDESDLRSSIHENEDHHALDEEFTRPEDNEDILHPLREAANRVGREVERFAEVLDGYNPKRITVETEKHEMTTELIDHYHGIAVETLDRLREQHDSERRRKDGARWRKKMRGFKITQGDEMDIEDLDDQGNPNPEPRTTLEDLERWELEAQTWDLLRRLVDLRFPPPGAESQNSVSKHLPLHQYSSERDAWKKFLEFDDLALERKTVLQWLRDTAEESGEEIDVLVQELQQNADRGDIIAHGWLHTKSSIKNQKRLNAWPQALDPASPEIQRVHLNSSKTEPLVTQLDPDSATRQGRKLEAQDEYFERAIWLGCYEMLRRGRSATEIKEWCQERTEIWRAVSMSGFPDETADEDDEPATSGSSALWRRMCFALARKGGADEYERAVYGILSGDIASVEPACRSWNDFLFVHYNALLRTQFDTYLQTQVPQKSASNSVSSFGAFDAVQFHGEPKTAALKLVESLKNDPRTKSEATHPMKMLQGVLIADQFDNFVYQQGLALSKYANSNGLSILIPPTEEQPENQDINKYIALDDHDSLRVLAHMLLIFVNLGVDFGGILRQTVIENIIVSYISFLRLAGKEELISLYCSQLSGNRRYATLCRSLIDVTDPGQRVTQIKLMRELGLDAQQFVKLQSRYLMQDYPDRDETYPALGGFNVLEAIPWEAADSGRRVRRDFMGEPDAVEQVDKLLIRSLEWYLLVEGLWSETFLFGSILYKRFFKHVHLAAASFLATKIPSSIIARNKTRAILGATYSFADLEGEEEEDLTEVLDGSAEQKKLLKKYMLAEAKSYRELETLIELLDNIDTSATLAHIYLEDQDSAERQQSGWRRELSKSVQLSRDGIAAVLKGWLLSSQSEEEEFGLIREAFLPEALLAYISILRFAGFKLTRQFFMECMDLSTHVAAEDSDLLELFVKTGRVPELVEEFASASKKLLITTTSGKKSGAQKSKKLRSKGWTQELWNIHL
ncbi:Nucleoporin NUP84 [Phlyctema vagabunda]|uniref:Nuclear pore complex protein n=1 Tax=Phlyctema vagabunda TaxID=108571 RepID=A0ABR4PBK5_9HELO